MIQEKISYYRILSIAIPTILSNLSVPLVGLVDLAVIGWFNQSAYLAAITVGASIFSMLFWAFGFLRMGITGSLGQLLAGNDKRSIEQLLQRYFILALAASVVIFILGNLTISYLISPFENGDIIFQQGLHEYIGIRLWSAPFTLMNYVILGVLLALGNAKWLLLTQLTLNAANIVLSWFFAWVLQWGIPGVALGSVLAEVLAATLGLFVISRALSVDIKNFYIPQKTGSGVVDKKINQQAWLSIFTLNSNIFIRTLLLTFAFTWFTQKGAMLGTTIVAVNGVLFKFVEIIAFALDGFAFSVESLAARAIGKKNWQNFVDICQKSIKASLVSAVLLSLLLYGYTEQLTGFITADAEIIAGVMQYRIWCVVLVLLGVFAYLLDGVFLAAAAGRGLRNGMIMAFVVYAIALMLLGRLFGNHGLWCAMNLFMLFRIIGLCLQFSEIRSKFS